MLNWFLLILLVLSISSETFSGVFVNGYLKNIKAQLILVVGVTISTIHTAMALPGLMLGNQIGNFADALSAIILLMIGMKIAIKSFKPKFQEMLFELNKPKVLVGILCSYGHQFIFGRYRHFVIPAFVEQGYAGVSGCQLFGSHHRHQSG